MTAEPATTASEPATTAPEPATMALLFPGQGSQQLGMREIVARELPGLLERAESRLGVDLFDRVDEGTHLAQPAIYLASLAHWRAAGAPAADAYAGHSLGELAALVAAGSLDPEQGLELVALRGELMQRSAEASGASGSMLALVGDAADAADEIAAAHDITVANDNAPGQVVLSGDRAALREAAADVKARGLRALELPVAGAFHSPAMAGAVAPFRAALDAVELRDPGAPVYCAAIAAPFDDVRVRLAEAITQPVRWRQTLLALRAAGITRFIETGPGRVLTGLTRRTLDDVEAATLERLAISGV